VPGGFEQGFAVGILPMNRLPGSPRLRASAAIFYCLLVWITDDVRLKKGVCDRISITNDPFSPMIGKGMGLDSE
jgi:hypothetical protein